MSFADRVGMYLFALTVGGIMGVWGCWVAESDTSTLARGECMVRIQKERNVTPKEAWEMCK
jgi:hypothetical protein